MRRAVLSLALFAAVSATACADPQTDTLTEESPFGVSAKRAPAPSNGGVQEAAESAIRALAPEIEARYGSAEVRLLSASWIGDPDQLDMGGNTVFFKDRGNKSIGAEWVPGDPRRGGRTNILWATDTPFFVGMNPVDVDAAIDAAMATWNGQQCSTALPLEKTTVFDPGLDLVHAGFVGLAPTTIAATFPFIWIDASTGAPTDIDGDGNLDYAFALIYYNGLQPFATDGVSHFDLQTIALHEAGHGLAQAHFGKAFRGNNGKLHFAPRAVMNAAYSGIQRDLTGTDNAGHCSIWGSWPNN
jgi:hypothetical protein